MTAQPGLSHVHYQTDVPVAGTEPDGDEVLDLIAAHYSSSGHNMTVWRNATFNNVELVRIRVREEVEYWSGEIGAVFTEDINLMGTIVHSGSTAQTPSGLCAWFAFTTGVASRSARGGTHGPFLGDVNPLDVDGTFVTTGGWYTPNNTLADAIEDALENVFQTTGDINPVVYSRTRRMRGQSPYTFQIDEVELKKDPRWLRRRQQQGA